MDNDRIIKFIVGAFIGYVAQLSYRLIKEDRNVTGVMLMVFNYIVVLIVGIAYGLKVW